LEIFRRQTLDAELKEIDEMYTTMIPIGIPTITTRGIKPTTPKSKAPTILQKV